jgi:hypothetical protein
LSFYERNSSTLPETQNAKLKTSWNLSQTDIKTSMPKVLFIASQESDYLQDTVFTGLRDLIGTNNLFEFPFRKSYYRRDKEYPRNLGVATTEATKLSWPQLLQRRFHRADFKKFDAVIVGSCKPETFESYMSIQDQLPDHCPLIFIDGGDRPEVGGDLDRLGKPELFQAATAARPFDFIFKREYLINASYPPHIHPLPFAINPDLLPPDSQDLLPWINDVTFWAVESDPIRTQALALIENRFDCQKNESIRNQTFRKYRRKGLAYLQELKQSKITLNFRGVGWDTLRYWEVTALGRFLVSQKPQIVIPHNFREGTDIVYCKDNLSDLIDICQHYLDHDSAREKIAASAGAWSRSHHTPIARAKVVLEKFAK